MKFGKQKDRQPEAIRPAGPADAPPDRLKKLIQVSNELARMESVEDVCRRAVELGRTVLGFDRLGIWFHEEDPELIRGMFGTDEQGRLRDERARTVPIDRHSYLDEIRRGRTSTAMRVEGDLHDDSMHVVGKGSWACAAMWNGEEVAGYIMLDNLIRREPISDEDCEVLSLFASSLGHICLLKRAEEGLRQRESEYRHTLDSMRDAIQVIDRDRRIVLLNETMKQWAEALGVKDLRTGRTVFEVFPFLPPEVGAEYDQVFKTGRILATAEQVEVNGQYVHTETRKIPIFQGSEVVRVVTAIRDVTERKKAETALKDSQEQLQQAQKMEALGRLAGGIAHDFNNLLTTILGYGHLVHDRLEPGSPMQMEMEEIVHAGDRAVELTSQLLAFGRRKMGHVRPVNINTVVMETDRLMRRTLGEDIELVTIPGDDLEGVKIEPVKLQQVIMNLAINARDAMPEGGKLTIETSKVHLDESYTSSRVGIEPGDYVRLVVRDTGSGMTEEVREHMFEPFYTTKDQGKGSGLGLSTAYGIVAQTGGWIDVATELGKGSEFTLYFPCQEEMSAEVISSGIERKLPGGKETLLVVEDEESVRTFTVKILESLGYTVIQASNGGEALLAYQARQKPIDMVLTDLVMPLMSGKELVRRLRESGSKTRVLYMSGFSDDMVADETDVTLLQKPFTRQTLARTLRSVLDRPA